MLEIIRSYEQFVNYNPILLLLVPLGMIGFGACIMGVLMEEDKTALGIVAFVTFYIAAHALVIYYVVAKSKGLI